MSRSLFRLASSAFAPIVVIAGGCAAALALGVAGCSSSDSPAPANTATDTGVADGPITERPDDGTDTASAPDSKADAADAPGDTASGDTASGDTGGGDVSDAPAPRTIMVGGSSLTFSPSTLTIKVGETVHWVWAASGHSVTSGDPATCTADSKFCSPGDASCAAGTASASGTTYDHKFDAAGTFPFFCTPHCLAGMKGSITVTP